MPFGNEIGQFYVFYLIDSQLLRNFDSTNFFKCAEIRPIIFTFVNPNICICVVYSYGFAYRNALKTRIFKILSYKFGDMNTFSLPLQRQTDMAII